MYRTKTRLVLACFIVALASLGPALASRSAALAAGATITMNVSPQTGAPTIGYGYDIKQPGKAQELATNPQRTQELFSNSSTTFGTNHFQVLRIPIDALTPPETNLPNPCVGNLSSPGVEAGYESEYGTMTTAGSGGFAYTVEATSAAMTQDPSLLIYANLKLQGTTPFASCMQQPNFVIRYAQVLSDYLEYMQMQRISVTHLGIFCEEDFAALHNQAGTTATESAYEQAYEGVVGQVRSDISTYNATVSGQPQLQVTPPTFVAPDTKHPGDEPVFLPNVGPSGTYGIASTHFYSPVLSADETGLAAAGSNAVSFERYDAMLSNPRSIWDTEFHWDNINNSEYQTDSTGLMAAFDNLDVNHYNPTGGPLIYLAVSNMTWWAFSLCATRTGCDPKSEMQTELVDTSNNGQTLAPPMDGDGTTVTPGTLITRAYQQLGSGGVTVANNSLLIVNDQAASFTNPTVQVNKGAGSAIVTTVPQCLLWTTSDSAGDMTSASTVNCVADPTGKITMIGTLPQDSIALVTFGTA